MLSTLKRGAQRTIVLINYQLLQFDKGTKPHRAVDFSLFEMLCQSNETKHKDQNLSYYEVVLGGIPVHTEYRYLFLL